MKLYVRKIGENSFEVGKETTAQSVVSDLISMLVIVVLIGCDIAFSILVTHSYVIDFACVAFIVFYLIHVGKKPDKLSKDEVKEMIDRM